MAKDWEYWKNQFIEDQIQSSLAWFERIEKLTMSPIESIAFLYLSEYADNNFQPLELEVLPQKKIGKYTVDFLLVHENLNLFIVIECDGHQFHEKTKKQAAHDKERDRFFTKKGYILLRYTGSQICEDPQEMTEDISEIIIRRMEEYAS